MGKELDEVLEEVKQEHLEEEERGREEGAAKQAEEDGPAGAKKEEGEAGEKEKADGRKPGLKEDKKEEVTGGAEGVRKELAKDSFTEFLPANRKERFNALKAEDKEFVKELYKDMQGGFTKKSQEFAAFEREAQDVIEQLAEVTRGRFENMGQLSAFISTMQNFERELEENPVRTLLVLAQGKGVSLEQLAGYRPNQAEEAVRPFRNEILEIKKMLGKQAQKTQAPAEEAERQDIVSTFKNAKDDKGNPLYPHFEKVKPIMGYIMNRDGHEDMEKAYKEAILTLPEVREAEKKAYEAKVQKEQAELGKAKRAAAIKTNSSAVLGTEKRKLLVDDVIRESMEEQGI